MKYIEVREVEFVKKPGETWWTPGPPIDATKLNFVAIGQEETKGDNGGQRAVFFPCDMAGAIREMPNISNTAPPDVAGSRGCEAGSVSESCLLEVIRILSGGRGGKEMAS